MKFNYHFCEQAKDLYTTGYTDADVARHFSINRATLYKWRKRYPEFDEAVRYGKYGADAEVVNSLFKLATGFSQMEEKLVMVHGEPKIELLRVYYPPNKEAIRLWLQMRLPEKW